VARLKAQLVRQGYLGQALGAPGKPPHGGDNRVDLPLHLARLRAPSPLAVLLRLFGLMVPVTEAQATEALAPIPLADLEEMGLLERREGQVRAAWGLSVYEGLLLAHDHAAAGAPLPSDHVLAVNPTTINLAQLTVRRPARTALDLGCGNGVQALLLARHAEQVTGVDVNPRALACARFNAALNGVENVTWLEGDFFAPVAGRRFDLVVSNPPYVISPESRLTFRDGGREGDAVSREVVVQAAAHLEEGGHATVLCNWGLRAGEAWQAPPRRWVAGAGCDALVLYRGAQDTLDYAAAWNRSRDQAAYQEALVRWSGYLEGLGLASVALGSVVLRRRSAGPNTFQAEELSERQQGSASAQLLRMLDAQPLLEGGDAALLARRWQADPDARVEQRLRPEAGAFVLEASVLRQSRGLCIEGDADGNALELLRLCDGRRTLGDAVGELCRQGGPDRASVLEVARRFAALGFLINKE
jgi:SAM-dependent methyltransferase